MLNWNVYFLEAMNEVQERKLQLEEQDSKRRYKTKR